MNAKDYHNESICDGDLVRCNWCGQNIIVNYDEDVCPCCHSHGYLMDIEN